jgi:FtsZ-interacting cell division protein ZipA
MLDVPRVENPAASFDLMVQIARDLARDLQVNLVDDQRVQFTDAGLAKIRAQIVEVEAKMCENNLIPGSPQALRLFS